MEMYNKDLAENASMIHGTSISNEPPSLKQHHEVSQVRKVLLVLIGTDLVLCLVNFLFVIHSYAASESLESQSPNSSSQLALIMVLLIYYGFGLFVTHRYYQTGSLVLAFLGLLVFFLTSAIIIALLLRIIHTATHVGFVTAGIIVAIIYVVICFLISILQIIIILYSFRFYMLLKKNKHLTIEQI